ncbi:MAG: chain length determinant protein EpsF [Burkholderiales bacterium]|nr:chain length determinant protein EpsF [Burkholderiales bacterium]
MNFFHYVSVLRARRAVILWILAGTVAAVMGVSLLMEKTYTATSALLIDVKLTDPVGGMPLGQVLLPETLQAYMTTQAEIIASQPAVRQVIEQVGLDKDPVLRGKWEAHATNGDSFGDWLAENVRKRLDVRPSRDSSVISISYSDTDRKRAAHIANAFAQTYLDTHLNLKVNPARRSAAFFDERTKAVREKLEQAQARLTAFERKHGFLASEQRLDVENARLTELSSQLTAIQAVAAEATYKQGQAESLSEVITSPLVQTLRGEVAKSEAKLSELGAQLGTNHPHYKRAEGELGVLRERLAAETARASNSVRAAARVTRQREAQIKDAYEMQREKVMAMRTARDQAALLIHDVENAKKEHNDLLLRLGQMNLESGLTTTNASILNRAPELLYPSSPKLVLNLVVSVLLGILGGIGTAFLLEILDRRFRDAEDLAETLTLPVLGVVESTADVHKLLPGSKTRPRLAGPGGSVAASAES